MKPSFWITLAASTAACCAILAVQARSNQRLSTRVIDEQTKLEEPSGRTAGGNSAGRKGAIGGSQSSVERVTHALAKVEQFVADLGPSGSSLTDQIAVWMEDGTRVDAQSFNEELPSLLRMVENLSLDELVELAGQLPNSQAKNYLVRLAAEQGPLRVMSNASLVGESPGIAMMDALARTDPAEALRRLPPVTPRDPNDKSIQLVTPADVMLRRRFAILMMRDDVERGLRALVEVRRHDPSRRIEDMGKMQAMSRAAGELGITSLQGVEIPRLIEAMDKPEFAEIRNDIIKMTLDQRLFDGGIEAVARQARAMPMTPAERRGYLNSIIDYEIMSIEPEATLEWIADAQTPETQLAMVPSLFLDWAKSDAGAARDWLSGHEPSPLRDATIAHFATKAPNLDRTSAAQWALEIENGSTRTKALRKVVNQWRKEDAPAADIWLTENGISL